jgi:hypothetical protein
MAFSLGFGCASESRGALTPVAARDPRANQESLQRVLASVLDDFHLAASVADEDRYFAHFAPDGVFLGTDASERWDVPAFRAYAHPHFARGKAWSFRATRRSFGFADDAHTAWFEEELATQNLGPARGSGVFVLRPQGWLLAQYNLAITVPNDRFRSVKTLLEQPSLPNAP